MNQRDHDAIRYAEKAAAHLKPQDDPHYAGLKAVACAFVALLVAGSLAPYINWLIAGICGLLATYFVARYDAGREWKKYVEVSADARDRYLREHPED